MLIYEFANRMHNLIFDGCRFCMLEITYTGHLFPAPSVFFPDFKCVHNVASRYRLGECGNT